VAPIREELSKAAPDTELLELDYLDGTAVLP
jgi:hypothetical protein